MSFGIKEEVRVIRRRASDIMRLKKKKAKQGERYHEKRVKVGGIGN